ncbi:GAF domain-containing sensor histidine kinase [Salsuginibacillus kocurii]|uniref:GAF domain-containing sensor histidine kinase n=1 Tax=Salsuginibacillus kocurii TaxID=427078 RepID=UPI0003767171|nr:GAF domain-containing sensor histidine kinase [Salsuginibacillus kocurii]
MKREDELFLTKRIAELLNRETHMESMLQKVLEAMLELTDLQTGWMFLLGENKAYTLAAHARLPEALAYDHCYHMCEGGCRCLDLCGEGRLKKAINIIECQRIDEAIQQGRGDTEGIIYHASVPLKTGDHLFGLLNVASPHKRKFSKDELHLLEAMALQIGTAYERIRLAERERAMEIMEERNRLARDLHDSVNQHLFSIMYTANGTKGLTAEDKVKAQLDRIHELSREALTEMKALIWQLRTEHISEGLEARFNWYAHKLELRVSCAITKEPLGESVEAVLWKIAQEAMNNIKKHASSTQTTIIVEKKEKNIILEVIDNGTGFSVEEVDQTGFGLTSMKERARLLDGSFAIVSAPGVGTQVKVTVPVKGEE